jgi:hypothetical protein
MMVGFLFFSFPHSLVFTRFRIDFILPSHGYVSKFSFVYLPSAPGKDRYITLKVTYLAKDIGNSPVRIHLTAGLRFILGVFYLFCIVFRVLNCVLVFCCACAYLGMEEASVATTNLRCAKTVFFPSDLSTICTVNVLTSGLVSTKAAMSDFSISVTLGTVSIPTPGFGFASSFTFYFTPEALQGFDRTATVQVKYKDLDIKNSLLFITLLKGACASSELFQFFWPLLLLCHSCGFP